MDDVRRLLDRAEITDLITRYTRAVDTADLSGFDQVFTEDAFIDYTASGGSAGPVAEVRRWLGEEAIPLFAQTQHLVGQVQIELDEAGDTAQVVAYFWNPIRIQLPDSEPFDLEIGGLYEHEMVRTDAGWRSRRLVEHVLWKK
jgi:hypothetical protein